MKCLSGKTGQEGWRDYLKCVSGLIGSLVTPPPPKEKLFFVFVLSVYMFVFDDDDDDEGGYFNPKPSLAFP